MGVLKIGILKTMNRASLKRWRVVFAMWLLTSFTGGIALCQQGIERKVESQSATWPIQHKLLSNFCFDCHDEATAEGGLNLQQLWLDNRLDEELVFENLINSKMPPRDSAQPTRKEKRSILDWLARQQALKQGLSPASRQRRISRFEFNQSLNDLLATSLNIEDSIPEDRGSSHFDTNRNILLTTETLQAYFRSVDQMLEFAFPARGFSAAKVWTTHQVRDSHPTYRIYVHPYRQGLLFSWTRANNGNNYSFFYDHFEPPEAGWYDLTFDAAKVGDFREDVTVQVYAGKYYFADDRPQPQRMIGVISLSAKKLTSQTIRAFLRPGENISVHCYSKHTWRQEAAQQGAYIRQLQVRGPVLESWPPKSFRKVFSGLKLITPKRPTQMVRGYSSNLEALGGRVRVSSFQPGREKEKMLDGSNQSFWHTRFKPDVAKPPHYVILENPERHPIQGLKYSTWLGGNGNGQVKAYEIAVSDDGQSWSPKLVAGKLEVQLETEQPILFPQSTRKRFIKFLITEAVSLDGKSLASIGQLDVIPEMPAAEKRFKVDVDSASVDKLRGVIKRFAEEAFSTSLPESELGPYLETAIRSLETQGDFVAATKEGLKSILCSHRFLLTPNEHTDDSLRVATSLAKCLWLSIPDQRLLKMAAQDSLTAETWSTEIERMLQDPKAQRWIHSFCNQWLNLRTFDQISPSLKLYPLYDDLLNYFLPLETEAYLAYLVQHNLPVIRLIDSDFSILNQRLAQHYDVPDVFGQELRKVAFQPDSPRGGLLTMGSVLKVTTDGFQTSPILRGAWISKNIVGNTLLPPPPNVKAIEPDSNRAQTLKEQIKAHQSQAECAACHKQIDPYGFALESFDATGRFRERYRLEESHQGTFLYRPEGYYRWASRVESSGSMGGIEFRNVDQFKRMLLRQHKQVAYNFAKKFFEYANGYGPTLTQRIELYDLIPAKAEQCRIRDLIVKVLIFSLEIQKNGRHR